MQYLKIKIEGEKAGPTMAVPGLLSDINAVTQEVCLVTSDAATSR